MANDPNIEQRIADETAKVTAQSYQKVASLGGWAGGGRTLWAISVVGLVAGAALGIVAPYFPFVLGAAAALPSVATLSTSILAFAATGMAMGFGGGLMLGRVSGTAAAVAQEQEKRLKEWTARQIVSQNPNAHITPDQPDLPEAKKSLGRRIKDSYVTYFNPRVGLAMAALGVVGGLIMASAIIATGGAAVPGALAAGMPALSTLTGLSAEALTPFAIKAYVAGVMGAFGALWTFNFPKITSDVTSFFGNLMSGKMLGREWGPKEPGKIHSQTQINYNQDVTIADGVIQESMAAKPKLQAPHKPQYASFQELIAKQHASADLGMKR